MDKCKHSLLVLASTSECTGVRRTVRWCQHCGAAVIDADIDGRVSPGHFMPMRLPKPFPTSKGGQHDE